LKTLLSKFHNDRFTDYRVLTDTLLHLEPYGMANHVLRYAL